jgi:hypothetical protein
LRELREIRFMKNQYGKCDDTIVLFWEKGIWRPVIGQTTLEKVAFEAKSDELFLTVLDRFTRENRNVSDVKGKTYAPHLFHREDEAKKAGIGKPHLENAMRRLFKASKVKNEQYGKTSNPHFRIART